MDSIEGLDFFFRFLSPSAYSLFLSVPLSLSLPHNASREGLLEREHDTSMSTKSLQLLFRYLGSSHEFFE